jgi:Fe(3+) dicitrate transport protein
LRYNSTVGTVLYQGKKNEQIFLDNTSSNLAINNTRQTFAKVPGINVWESDGSGTNVSIAARGLSPNRAWEFNTRQNGYDIAADPFGYPEAYYAPAFESLERIQVIRGAGALQYGPQMGGMVNYISKTRIKGKKIGLESNQTVGSYGLFNSYTAVGGETERLNYYGYFQHRNANGWRENSFYNLNSGSFNASYQISNKIKVGGEYIIWDNLSQQPGGLTDSIFNYNPRLSYRSRNWMNINWQIASVFVNADFKNFKLNWSTYSLMGDRRSVGNVGAIANTQGVVNYDNLNSNRTVDKDLYRNTGSELRFIYSYNILSLEHHLSGGLRYYNGNTQRVRGTGNSSVKPDFTILDPTKLSRDYNFATLNYAAFIENAISIGKQFTFVPGVRFENIQNTITGKQPLVISNTKQRFKILYGASAQYKFNNPKIVIR